MDRKQIIIVSCVLGAAVLLVAVCGISVLTWYVLSDRHPRDMLGAKAEVQQPQPDNPQYRVWRTRMGIYMDAAKDALASLEANPSPIEFQKKLAIVSETVRELPGDGIEINGVRTWSHVKLINKAKEAEILLYESRPLLSTNQKNEINKKSKAIRLLLDEIEIDPFYGK